MPNIHELQNLGRAKNAVQEYLVRRLLYPKVYLDANWGGEHADVLAIDRTGVGDVHAVKLVMWEPKHRDTHGYSMYLEKAVSAALRDFDQFPGQFRYLAIVSVEPKKRRWLPSKAIQTQSLAADGVGRTGILYVNVADEDANVEVLQKAERFRSSQQILDLADQYMARHSANWEVRE